MSFFSSSFLQFLWWQFHFVKNLCWAHGLAIFLCLKNFDQKKLFLVFVCCFFHNCLLINYLIERRKNMYDRQKSWSYVFFGDLHEKINVVKTNKKYWEFLFARRRRKNHHKIWFAYVHLSLTAYHLPLSTYHFPPTIYHLPLTSYRLPFWIIHNQSIKN